ncbi:hypothetical protein ABZ070_10170 [Streptomyces sp. NPDC006283]|uniref:hypothetical protein n=1 Tax=Streptomyces sp. NPDC006283 TaxID=3156741 RepID=UPI0033B06102
MTGPSSTPRGEKASRPGITWDTRLVVVETVVPDDDADDDAPTSRPNRATRRALARRKKDHRA